MTTNEALVERARAVLVANIEGAIDWEDVDDLGSLTPDEAIGAMLAFAALTPPAAEGEVTQADKRAAVAAGVLLPPAANVPPEYLEGWIEGQQYLLGNWRSATDATGKWEGPAPKVAGVEKAALRHIADADADPGTQSDQLLAHDMAAVARQALAAAPSAPGSGEG